MIGWILDRLLGAAQCVECRRVLEVIDTDATLPTADRALTGDALESW